MSRQTRFKGSVDYLRICAPDGTVDESLLEVDLPDETLVEMYSTMHLSRVLDQKALNMQRQGRLGTYAPSKGQEAAQVASMMALSEEDLVFPSYRENGALLVRDIPLENVLLYWGGDERGHRGLRERGVFPIAIPVGSQGLHAVGALRARQIQGDPTVGVTYFGDGATSEGDLLEAMNFAGVWEVPLVFFCQNNQWAISVPREQQTASETLAQKALAFGFEGIQVDGNDPLAVYQTVAGARRRARRDSAPVMIEAVTYRMGDHTTADDASRYRTEEELDRWREADPLTRTRRLLESRDAWDEKRQKAMEDRHADRIEEAVEVYESIEEPDPRDIFQYTYEEMPPHLLEQFQVLKEERTRE